MTYIQQSMQHTTPTPLAKSTPIMRKHSRFTTHPWAERLVLPPPPVMMRKKY